MRNITFLTYLHYVVYDIDNDKRLAVVTKSGIVKYTDKCDNDEREKIESFAKTEGEHFKEHFMQMFKHDKNMIWRDYLKPYELRMTDKQLDVAIGGDAEAQYKLALELQQAHYDSIYNSLYARYNH